MVVDIANPLQPKVTAQIGAPDLVDPRGVAVQFRYAFVVDREGLKVLDVTVAGESAGRARGEGPLERRAQSLRRAHVRLRRRRQARAW